MDIKIPKIKIKILRPQEQYRIAVEDIIKQYLKLSFWLSPLAFWKLYEIIKPYMDMINAG